MLEIRRDAEIHTEEGGWFKARWHFSFDRYRDPAQMGVGPLRVFNDDRLGTGDAVKAYGPDRIGLEAVEPTELILVDVPRDYARVGVWAR